MRYESMISSEELLGVIGSVGLVVVDCRCLLSDPGFGAAAFAAGHIPGAVFAGLLTDLTGEIIPGKTGRHPLPPVERLAARFGDWGIDAQTQVVAYDDFAGGSLSAAPRLWWLLRWLGHRRVAVLDGGWTAWRGAGGAAETEAHSPASRAFIPAPRSELLAEIADVETARLDPGWRVLDARTADRYRGENETIDPVAGHIPGAVSAPYPDTNRPDGRLRPAAELRAHFSRLLAGAPAEKAVFYCGSGITAAHNLLALAHAGLGEGRLYAGSWSEWITDPARPVER